ncbi:MAG: large subunit ribosomal protein L5 [Parcubacteria group bacterium Greene0416_14]|nr:MAG: large subunit ribosomal protein L5 [Parcubacteria group bacterium Greene0416_14]TSD00586.1 MAG: large subunit ribosomal protein L5 [Parcubacteria group bacterium Greene1014_15]TSD08277.1 MAG: large subunit ribosomal protein L5 [Parcubacteria group bacterium Greene0714_4]
MLEMTKEKQNKAFNILKEKFGYVNRMQAPRLSKVVVSSGVGSLKDKAKIALVADRLAKITGQKPAPRGAKQSVAAFKIRQGDAIGYQVTLRGTRMYRFLDKLFNVALPRTKDFRGIPSKAIDAMGNMTLAIREHTIFPETSDEDLKDVFGLAVTIVTKSRKNKDTNEEALAYFTHIGVPFVKSIGK